MDYNVGDQVIHSVFGPGEILQLDKKEVSGKMNTYYMVKTNTLTLWVPIDNNGERSLRPLTPRSQFKKLFQILTGPGEPLTEDRLDRKAELTERLRNGKIVSVCEVIRDLNQFNRKKKLNDYDSAILDRAKNFLISEWMISLSIPRQQAEKELRELLER